MSKKKYYYKPNINNYIKNKLLNKNTEKDNIQKSIFKKYINNKYKLIPWKVREDFWGETKYSPPSSKEWKNKVYFFNINYVKNLPIYDLNINKLIKGYFNLYFNNRVLKTKFMQVWKKRISLTKIYVSKAEIKHTSSKAIITIYTYNKERKSLIKRIYLLKKKFSLKRNIVFKEYYPKFFSVLRYYRVNRLLKKKKHLKWMKKFFKKMNFIFNKEKFLYIPKNFKEILKLKLRRELTLIKRLKYKLSLNNYKFEEKFLHKLSKLIGRFYKKKVEFNIINLKSFMLNSDIFTEILTIKIKRKRSAILRFMKILINKAFASKMAKENMITKKIKGRRIKSVDFSLLENKIQNLNLNSIINQGTSSSSRSNLDEILNELYYNILHNKDKLENEQEVLNRDYSKVKSIIFKSIKYKNIAGIRLEAKGRLTKRYRADKSVFKFKQKGGIHNMYSSKEQIPSVVYRGYTDANVEYSIQTSKVRIGSFAVKGWISGK